MISSVPGDGMTSGSRNSSESVLKAECWQLVELLLATFSVTSSYIYFSDRMWSNFRYASSRRIRLVQLFSRFYHLYSQLLPAFLRALLADSPEGAPYDALLSCGRRKLPLLQVLVGLF